MSSCSSHGCSTACSPTVLLVLHFTVHSCANRIEFLLCQPRLKQPWPRPVAIDLPDGLAESWQGQTICQFAKGQVEALKNLDKCRRQNLAKSSEEGALLEFSVLLTPLETLQYLGCGIHFLECASTGRVLKFNDFSLTLHPPPQKKNNSLCFRSLPCGLTTGSRVKHSTEDGYIWFNHADGYIHYTVSSCQYPPCKFGRQEMTWQCVSATRKIIAPCGY